MKVIYNNLIPFKGYLAMNLFGILFVRKDKKDIYLMNKDIIDNHEKIHTSQMKELLYLFFYIIYLLNYIINILSFKFRSIKESYRNIKFEKEAYQNERDMSYLKNRKHFAWWRI